MGSLISSLLRAKFLSPFLLFSGLVLMQSVKLGIILAQVNSSGFKYWFYQCFQYPPSSWLCRTETGVPFPMPYSLLWYAIYVPLTSRGYWVFNITMFSVDSFTGTTLFWKKSQLYAMLWAQGAMYFL